MYKGNAKALMIALLLCSSFVVNGRTLSPYDFGLSSAKDGYEVFRVLQKTHEAAVSKGYNVTYKGIELLEIDIPADAKSIPLPREVDFCGVRMIVRNNSKPIYLFTLTSQTERVNIDKKQLQTLDFRSVPELKDGSCLLVIEDKTPWVDERKGHSYGAIRKDIIFVKHGRGKNNVVFPYTSDVSIPQASYCKVDTAKKMFSNLVFERTVDSKGKTFLLRCVNQYNVELRNITINTPKSGLTEDCAISIVNCAKIVFKDITINGTYSAKNQYGYGISLNNVWNSEFIRLKGKAEWGFFGNNNVNHAVLRDCDINRFDIHCYGRDVYCYNTVFRDLYNQFSSLFGNLVFQNCTFDHFVPLLFESTYSAYTFFDLKIKNCVFNVDANRPYLINAGDISDRSNVTREELALVSWPNVEIDGLTINLPYGVERWFFFRVNNKDVPDIAGISTVKIKGLNINSEEDIDYIWLSNREINTSNKLKVTVKSSNIEGVNNYVPLKSKMEETWDDIKTWLYQLLMLLKMWLLRMI